MTDGNTAIQVSPVLSEGEMKSFQELFSKIANTITQASSLAGEFEGIKKQVSGLTNDLEYQRSRNSTLDEAITHLRTERDEANRLLSEGRVEWGNLKSDLAFEVERNQGLRVEREQLTDALAQTKHDADEAMFKVLELTEELDKAKASLASIHKALGIVPAVEPATPIIPKIEESGTSAALEKTDPVFVGSGSGFSTDAPHTDAVERRKIYYGDNDFSSETWYDAKDGEYGTTSDGKRWHYIDAKLIGVGN